MQLNPSEISELIKKRIENFDVSTEARNEGTVVGITDGIVRIHGLSDVMLGEMIEFPGNIFGMALNLEQDSVGAVVLGAYEGITEGDKVQCTKRILEVPVGPGLLGRVVNSLGVAIDGKGAIEATSHEPIEKVAPGVIERKSVDQPVQTGLKAIDAMVPVGRGQRELIIGDRRPVKRLLLSMPSSTKKIQALNVSTLLSAKRLLLLRQWFVNWKSTARWHIPLSLPRLLLILLPCSTSHRMPVAPWVNTSVTVAKTP